jgi:hypothetical protein
MIASTHIQDIEIDPIIDNVDECVLARLWHVNKIRAKVILTTSRRNESTLKNFKRDPDAYGY